MRIVDRLKKNPDSERSAISAAIHEYPPENLPKQLTVFLVVGVLSTAAEFLTLNFFLYVVHWSLIVSNIFGVTAGLIVTYYTDKKWVFRRSRPLAKRHFGYFVTITLATLYGLQNLLIYIMTVFPEAQNSTAGFVHSILSHTSIGAIKANTIKIIASTVVGVINFFLYRKFVFTYDKKRRSGKS